MTQKAVVLGSSVAMEAPIHGMKRSQSAPAGVNSI